MNVKNIFSTSGLLRLALVACGVVYIPSLRAQSVKTLQPNFLLITYEDTTAHHFGPNDKSGLSRTPAVDRLAREGVNYTHYFGVAAVCAPNRSCWISGVYPNSLGSQNMRSDAGPLMDVVTYPELLRKAGYFTANNVKTDYNFASPKTAWNVHSQTAHWRDRKDPSCPFLAVFNIISTHQGCVQSPAGYARSGGRLPPHQKADRSKVGVPSWLPDTPETREAVARTWDCVNYADRQVAHLLRQLEEDGLLDTTWVFLMSDHGDGGYPRAKTYLYDSGLRAGLVIRPPGGKSVDGMPKPGSDDDRLVSFVDLAPTLLQLAGIKPPPWCQGRPFIGTAVPPAPEAVIAARDRINGRYDCVRAIRTATFKYIRNYQPWKPLYQEVPGFEAAPAMQALRAAMTSGTLPEAAKPFCKATRQPEELYDVSNDPDELRNLAADPAHAATLAEMRARLAAHYKKHGDLGFIPEGMLDKMGKAAGARRKLLESSYDTLRAEQWAGFDQLGRSPDAQIAGAIASNDPIAQYYACIAIGNRNHLPDGIAVEAVRKLLDADYGDLAAAAAWALIKSNLDRSAADAALSRVVKHGTWQERLNALNLIDYLGPLGEPLLPLVRETGQAIRKRMETDNSLSCSDRYCAEQCEVTLLKRGMFNGLANRMSGYANSADPEQKQVAGLEARVKQTPSGPVLFVNGQVMAPAMFFVNFDTSPELAAGQLQQIGMAAKQGVNIVSFPFGFSGTIQSPDFTETDRRMDACLKANPKALALVRISLCRLPGERMVSADGSVGPLPSIHSAQWLRESQAFLRKMVAHLESKYPNAVIGYHPCGQSTAEWFYEGYWEGKTPGFEPTTRQAFRAWLKAKYTGNDGLKRAWSDAKADLETAAIPSPPACTTSTTGSTFRDPQAERKVIDFFEFQNDAMADTVACMCRTVKEAAPNKLAVAFYGYTFELAGASQGLQSSGHLSLWRLLASPQVDAICAPGSYMDWMAGGGGYFMGAVDSVNLHGKLWLMEDDTRTHLCTSRPSLKDARETTGVLARNFAHVVTRGDALWWMDLLGQGWFNDETIWTQLGKMNAAYSLSMNRLQAYRPEVAVIVDEKSCLDLHPASFLTGPLLGAFRTSWYRIGAPVGIYLLDDLVHGNVPPAKMYLFLNAFRLDDSQLQAIRKQACRDGSTVLWMYAPGMVRKDRLDTEAVSEVTGIRVTQAAAGGERATLTGSGGSFPILQLNPAFAVTDAETTPLAKDDSDGRIVVASKRIGSYTSVYSAVLQLPPTLLRDLARQAGVHIYNDQNDVVMAGNGFIALHASSAGEKVLRMLKECRLVDVLTGEIFDVGRDFRFNMQVGDTKLFQIGPPASKGTEGP